MEGSGSRAPSRRQQLQAMRKRQILSTPNESGEEEEGESSASSGSGDSEAESECAEVTEHRRTCDICRTETPDQPRKRIKKEVKAKVRAKAVKREGPFTCLPCGKVYKRKTELDRHSAQHKEGYTKIPCPKCEKTFHQKGSLLLHIRSVHLGEQPYACPQPDCGKKFSTGSNMKTHLLTHFERVPGGDPFLCPECGKTFQQKGHLSQHIRVVHEKCRLRDKLSGKIVPAICDQCSKSFSSKASLASHVRAVHEGERTHPCPDCEKMFFSRSHLMDHIQTHFEEKPFTCDQCGKSYSQKSNLNTHLRIHAAERLSLYSCELCDKTFTKESTLNNHLKAHQKIFDGERPHECEKCGARFVHSTALRCHERSAHSAPSPHVCSTCGRSFAQKSHLDSHFLIHNGLKPFACDICGKTFRQKSNMTTHQRIHAKNAVNHLKTNVAKCDVAHPTTLT